MTRKELLEIAVEHLSQMQRDWRAKTERLEARLKDAEAAVRAADEDLGNYVFGFRIMASQIAAASIVTSKIPAGGVPAENIIGQIVGSQIKDASVGPEKLRKTAKRKTAPRKRRAYKKSGPTAVVTSRHAKGRA